MGIAIRLAELSDAEAIAGLWASADLARRGADRPVDGTERTLRRLAADGTVVVVAEDGDEIVAVAIAEPARTGGALDADPVPGLAHMTQVAVRPDRWGEGLGRLVVSRLTLEMRRMRYHMCQLWTQESNTRAQALYVRLGWVASGRTTVDERGETIRHYQLEL